MFTSRVVRRSVQPILKNTSVFNTSAPTTRFYATVRVALFICSPLGTKTISRKEDPHSTSRDQ